MSCGSCGGKNKTFKFRYVGPDGKTVYYDEEVQAKAAVIKNGGQYRKVSQ